MNALASRSRLHCLQTDERGLRGTKILREKSSGGERHLIGRRYNDEKAPHGGQESQVVNFTTPSEKGKTRTKVANETETSEYFVKTAAKLNKAMEAIKEVNPKVFAPSLPGDYDNKAFRDWRRGSQWSKDRS
jgi:hypothetical protein